MQQAHACKEERQSRTPARMRQQPCSEVTLRVNGLEGTKPEFMRLGSEAEAVN